MNIVRLLPIVFLLTIVDSQTTVDCNFDANTLCNWQNMANDSFDWSTGTSVTIDAYHSIPRSLTGTGSFAYAQGRLQGRISANNDAQLQSPQISQLTTPATLIFSYWKTAIPPILDICTQEEGEPLRCLDSISGAGPQEWAQRQATIPPNPLPFRIVLRARNFNTGLDIIGIDDIRFRIVSDEVKNNVDDDQQQQYASLPRSLLATFRRPPTPFGTNESSQQIAVNRPQSLIAPHGFRVSENVANSLAFTTGTEQIPGGCTSVRCQFVDNFCRWRTPADSAWKLATTNDDISQELGRHVLVDGAQSRNPALQSIMESDEFVVPASAFFEFSVSISNALVGRLSVYEKGAKSSTQIWSRSGYESIGGRGWHRIRVPIQASSFPMTIVLVAEGLSTADQTIHLDNTKLVNIAGEEIGCGSNVETHRMFANQLVTPDRLRQFRLTAYQSQTPSLFEHSTTASDQLNQFLHLSKMPSPSTIEEFDNRASIVIRPFQEDVNFIEQQQQPQQQQSSSQIGTDYYSSSDEPNGIDTSATIIPNNSQQQQQHRVIPPGARIPIIRNSPPIPTNYHQFRLPFAAANAIADTTTTTSTNDVENDDDIDQQLEPIRPINAPSQSIDDMYTAGRSIVQEIDRNTQFGKEYLRYLGIKPIIPIVGQQPSIDQQQEDVALPSPASNMLSRLTKDIERLFGIPLTRRNDADRPFTTDSLDFIVQNALAG